MEKIKGSPSEIDSIRVISALNTLKKRKLQAEQLGLPISKHKCWDRAVASDGQLSTFLAKEKAKRVAIDDKSEAEPLESAKDSNSFGEDYDCATSAYNGAKMEVEYAKTEDMPSSSSLTQGTDILGKNKSLWSSLKAVKGDAKEEEELVFGHYTSQHKERMQACLNLEEQLLEYGDESLEQCTDKELEDILYAEGLNPNVYVLSSGRWTVNQETEASSRKPTIDQEFEEYFSMLML
ncbi:protein FAR-RED ELONGATED HYPOCOTYL 1-like isoform X2 [Humulus lupulus]|uniref:protein FAR-RED ELONGATED HYPOCOTYL 1-like isoform X2 n=1 Tax=Humulus lupulus TaxID=3486 RepID=UPI002B409047|nr:protein FAR-RED ELONGATED HYPOCOTYL 1-like isoform X2 [Humulus lupulus]